MILMCEGVPGSGKSYWGVWKKLLPALKAGRRIYVYLDGAFLEKWALFLGEQEEAIQKRVTVWMTAEEVKQGILTVEPKSLVFIDECQTIFRGGERPDKDLLRWFEVHRHIGVDVVLLCQSHGQVTVGLVRLVESTVSFKKLWAVGLENRAQGFVRGNPDETVTVRPFTFKYKPDVYVWYSSYNGAEIEETSRGQSVWKSASVVTSLAAGVFAVVMLFNHKWSFGKETEDAIPAPSTIGAPSVGKGDKKAHRKSRPAVAASAGEEEEASVCITGHMQVGKKRRYLLEDGSVLGLDGLAARTGKPVYEAKNDDGFTRPFGEGIQYGRCNAAHNG